MNAPHPDYVKTVIPALLIACILGGIEMRVAIARVEISARDLDQRVQRIERHFDAEVSRNGD